jgi:hypothetical protein
MLHAATPKSRHPTRQRPAEWSLATCLLSITQRLELRKDAWPNGLRRRGGVPPPAGKRSDGALNCVAKFFASEGVPKHRFLPPIPRKCVAGS